MADVSTDQVIEISKIVGASYPVIGNIIGGIVAFIGLAGTIFTAIGNHRTKKNTEAQAAHTALMIASKAELETAKNDAIKSIKESADSFKVVVVEEARKLKLGVMKVKDATDEKLGMIPKVQDAIVQLQRDTENLKKSDKINETNIKIVTDIIKGGSGKV